MSKKEEKYDNMDISGKDVQVDNGYVNHQKNVNQPGSSSTRSNRSTQNKDTKVRRPVDIESVPEVALDDIAIKAMISILSGYIKSFLKDQDFRTSMYHNCFAAINFSLCKGKNNRNKLEDGSVSKHTGDSIYIRQHKKRTKATLKRPPTGVELYARLHTKRSTQEYITPKAAKVKTLLKQQIDIKQIFRGL
ncbi:unnamed protein product [Lactuca saligna]|uniref:Putative E3 ubiquitin-protein ligase LIN N-terminal domain-containing protein n=1 Tax=Lactuca saligna TaxID=75948 RepID=A0AA35YDY8_LACSI|nr:unnamed protein product [Lactuca saligna]